MELVSLTQALQPVDKSGGRRAFAPRGYTSLLPGEVPEWPNGAPC